MKIKHLDRPEESSGIDGIPTTTPDPLKSKSAGKALQRAFHQEELHKHVEEQKASVSYLMNSNRRSTFIHLCANPCDHVRGVARAMNLSAPAATWHLQVLCESGHLSESKFRRKKVFWPAGLVRSKDIEMVATMRMPSTISIMKAISGMPGRVVKENLLVSKLDMSQQNTNLWLGRLVHAGLLTKNGTGPGTVYSISPTSINAAKQYNSKVKDFSEFIIQKLDVDGLRPRKVQVRGTRLSVEVTLPGGKERLKFECHPLNDLARILK